MRDPYDPFVSWPDQGIAPDHYDFPWPSNEAFRQTSCVTNNRGSIQPASYAPPQLVRSLRSKHSLFYRKGTQGSLYISKGRCG